MHFFTFDHDLGIKVTQNVAQYASLHNVTYPPAKFEVATSISLESSCICKKIHSLTLNVGSRSHKLLPHSLHHMTYASAKFDVATSNGSGVDAFTRKYSI